MSERRSSGPGCLKISLGIGCIAPAAFCCGLIVIALIIAVVIRAGREQATQEAIERNGGRGAFESPIAASAWMAFKDGQVRATRVIRPAAVSADPFRFGNAAPAAGAEYAVVWFELSCTADKCDPGSIKLRLTGTDGTEWDEKARALVDNFDSNDAVKGGTTSGWQCFEVPTGTALRTIRVEWGAETLHVGVP